MYIMYEQCCALEGVMITFLITAVRKVIMTFPITFIKTSDHDFLLISARNPYFFHYFFENIYK